MTRDQKQLLLMQVDLIIELGEDISAEKREALLVKLRESIQGLNTGKRKSSSEPVEEADTNEL